MTVKMFGWSLEGGVHCWKLTDTGHLKQVMN